MLHLVRRVEGVGVWILGAFVYGSILEALGFDTPGAFIRPCRTRSVDIWAALYINGHGIDA